MLLAAKCPAMDGLCYYECIHMARIDEVVFLHIQECMDGFTTTLVPTFPPHPSRADGDFRLATTGPGGTHVGSYRVRCKCTNASLMVGDVFRNPFFGVLLPFSFYMPYLYVNRIRDVGSEPETDLANGPEWGRGPVMYTDTWQLLRNLYRIGARSSSPYGETRRRNRLDGVFQRTTTSTF